MVSVVIFVFLAFFSISEIFPVSSSLYLTVGDGLPMASGRAKRDSSDGENSTDCVWRCLFNLSVSLGPLNQSSMISGMTGLTRSVIQAQYQNQSYLDDMCNSYMSSQACVSTCTDHTAVAIILKGLGELEYICMKNVDEFKRQSVCMAPVIKETDSDCSRNCMQYYPNLQPLELPRNDTNGTVDIDVKNLLGAVCMLAKCDTTCVGEKLGEKCGVQAKRLLAGALVASIVSFTDLVMQMGAVQVVPVACIQISRLGFVFQEK